MSLRCGIDLGSDNLVASYFRDSCFVLENELSKRKSPVGLVYKDMHLLLGDTGKSSERRNYNMSFYNISDLYSLIFSEKYKENHPKIELDRYIYHENKEFRYIGIKLSEKEEVYPETILLILVNNIQKQLKMKNENKLLSCTFAVPPIYNEKEVKYLYELFKEMSVSCNNIISTSLCEALSYGYENNIKYKENESEFVMIVDSGYLYSSVSCIKYQKNQLKMIYEECYMYRSGKKEDIHLLEILNEKIKLSEEFKNIDIYSSSNYYLKCKESIIKNKEKLSASGADSVNIEIPDLYKDEDFNTTLSVEELNNKMRDKNIVSCSLATMIFRGLKEFEKKCKDFDIKKFQLVIQGGTCRIPFIQESINGILEGKGVKPSVINQTLNLDESVANGCSYYELIKSEKWKYEIEEYNPDIINKNTSKNKNKKHKNKQCYKDIKLNKSIELNDEEIDHIKVIVNQANEMIKTSEEVDLLLMKKNDYESELYSIQNKVNNSNISSEEKDVMIREINKLINELKELKVFPGMNMNFENKINEFKHKLNA